MIEGKELLEFATEMIKILNEKSEKYQDDFKNTTIGVLRERMNEQIKDISKAVCGNILWDRVKVKRKLYHIANYCFLLCNKIDEEL